MINNSSFSKKLTKTQIKIIILFISLTFSAILISLLLKFSHSRNHSLSSPLYSFINKACSETLYSSLCRSTLSGNNSTTFVNILEFTVNRTLSHVEDARITIADHLINQDLNTFQDCMELLDQTLYELESAMEELGSSPSSYGNIKTLLSAAMTNQHTCINGFLELNQLYSVRHLQKLLTPISQMISNTLALIKHVEISQETTKKMIIQRKIVRRKKNLRPNAIVGSDGKGDYNSINEAIAAAPNMSKKTYVIRIKAGVYTENVFIPRQKINIMLVGDGMNTTIITGSRSFVDGFSTFESATLTVVGDKFMARDITIKNTAPPEKHQAVAVRVTSNAAFLRCEIISHQDTLYAHSLRQLYHQCRIQGTIDFIFGNAAAVFQNCSILVSKPVRGQRNTITAQGREDPNQNTGFSLQNCTVKAAPEFGPVESKHVSTYLGRPWRNYSRVMVGNSYLGEVIHPRGWLEWAEYSSGDSVEYIECLNYGPGAATRRRVSWEGYRNNCSGEALKQFRVEEFLHGPDGWLEYTVLPIFAAS